MGFQVILCLQNEERCILYTACTVNCEHEQMRMVKGKTEQPTNKLNLVMKLLLLSYKCLINAMQKILTISEELLFFLSALLEVIAVVEEAGQP